ncbi:MAG: glycosyltransferase family 4 protein [Cyclobacteriaceae bacterium]|jgi:glycosyltransferase involved in cell wall biosynthesis|nr:glycosyltransferase family 4 protein [Cyclobacteriaceae bacterium]
MNVLLITQEDYLTGAAHSVAFLAEGLAERGHRVWVMAKPGSFLEELVGEKGAVRFLPLTLRSRWDWKAITHLRDVVRAHDIQIVNAQSSKDRYVSIFARLFFGLPCLVFHTRRQYPLSAGGPLQTWLYTRFTERIIVISHELKQIFIKKGYPARSLHVIHNGIPASRLAQWSSAQVDAIRARFMIAPGDVVVGAVSRPKKQEQILKAVKQLGNPQIKIVLVGVPEGHYDALRAELGLANPVMYAGFVPSEEVLNYYALFSVSVLASTMDGFGLVLVEAMAMGCPVVATNFGGIRDVVTHGENGLLFEDGDIAALARAIDRCVREPDLRAALIARGHETVTRFSLEQTVTRYEQFFEECIRQSHNDTAP